MASMMGSPTKIVGHKQKVVQEILHNLYINIRKLSVIIRYLIYIYGTLQKLGHQDLDDEFALSAIAYKGSMSILGVDNKEFAWGDNGLTNLVVRIKSIVVLLIEGYLTLTKSRDMLIGNSLGLRKGYMDVNILAVQLKFNHIGGGQLGVNNINEEVGTIKLNAT